MARGGLAALHLAALPLVDLHLSDAVLGKTSQAADAEPRSLVSASGRWLQGFDGCELAVNNPLAVNKAMHLNDALAVMAIPVQRLPVDTLCCLQADASRLRR